MYWHSGLIIFDIYLQEKRKLLPFITNLRKQIIRNPKIREFLCVWWWLNLNYSHTCAKLTLVHFVPLVNVLKEAVPSNIPEGVPRNAIQFTIADPFVPRPDSNKHTRKLLWVTSDVHTTAESWTLRDSFSWLIDARTRTFPELENVRRNCTLVQ